MRRREKYLERLRRIADEDNSNLNRRYAAIVDARTDGFTLEEIGDALGVTKQRVHQIVTERESRA